VNRKLVGGIVAVLACVCVMVAAALAPARGRGRFPYGGTGNSYVETYCAHYKPSGEYCLPGKGEPTEGGGSKTSHEGWPFNDGVYWKVYSSGSGKHHFTGGPKNDELLGHGGSDTINGGGGSDVIWGDWDAHNNGSSQYDTLIGGPGRDFIYPSHGYNVVNAGPGNDVISAFYGRGIIDCGPGRDVAEIRENHAFRTRNCEVVRHFHF
jgi:Ca2+-binding RTX toxin-like protein